MKGARYGSNTIIGMFRGTIPKDRENGLISSLSSATFDENAWDLVEVLDEEGQDRRDTSCLFRFIKILFLS